MGERSEGSLQVVHKTNACKCETSVVQACSRQGKLPPAATLTSDSDCSAPEQHSALRLVARRQICSNNTPDSPTGLLDEGQDGIPLLP